MAKLKEAKKAHKQPAAELATLRARLAELEETARLGQALERVRDQMRHMESEEDWGKVVACLAGELRELIEFDGCGIAIVDLERRNFFVYDVTPAGGRKGELCDFLPRSLEQAVESNRPVYRRNRAEMARFGDNIGPERRSVIDAPFGRGTIGLNSAREDAFSARDIQILEQFARVVCEGIRRLEALKELVVREQELYQLHKLEAISQLATGVAHEINNPLTSVVGYSELLLLRQDLDAQMRQYLETIHHEGWRAQGIAERLLRFARRQKSPKQRVELNPLVEETLELVRQPFELDHVRLVEELAGDLPLVEIHPGQLQQVILGLVQNGREALLRAGQRGAVTVRTRRQEGGVRLEVEDDGPGIAAEVRERIFEPFFTTKEVGKGTGLGLSLCHAIAREHGGRLWAAPRQKGACLVFELPAAPPEKSSEKQEGS